MKNSIKFLFSRLIAISMGLFLMQPVFAGYNIGTGSGAFQSIGGIFQSYVDFMTGPFGKVVVLSGIFIGLGTWAVLPEAKGIIGYAIRVAIAGAVLFNITVWMGIFGTGN
jgi:hypothetical protein